MNTKTDMVKSMKKIITGPDLWLLILCIISIIICLTYAATIDVPEIVIDWFHGGAFFSLLNEVAIGYIVSYIFYNLIKSLYDKRETQLKKEILVYIYRSLIKRLTECTLQIEREFDFIDVVSSKMPGFNYHGLLFTAFEHNEQGLKGLRILFDVMNTTDYKAYVKARCEHSRCKPDKFYDISFSNMAIKLYESDDFKNSFNDIMQLIPQILLYENDHEIKQIVSKLFENILDTREIINGDKEVVTGSTYPHLVRFVKHTIFLYELLLKKEITLRNSYQT